VTFFRGGTTSHFFDALLRRSRDVATPYAAFNILYLTQVDVGRIATNALVHGVLVHRVFANLRTHCVAPLVDTHARLHLLYSSYRNTDLMRVPLRIRRLAMYCPTSSESPRASRSQLDYLFNHGDFFNEELWK